ncbi:hypothetical protein ACF0H5_019372 [Mactra antiquata]
MQLRRRGEIESQAPVLYIRIDREKGRCVHTRTQIFKGSQFLKYEGTLCQEEPQGDDTYIYEFTFKGKTYWYGL